AVPAGQPRPVGGSAQRLAEPGRAGAGTGNRIDGRCRASVRAGSRRATGSRTGADRGAGDRSGGRSAGPVIEAAERPAELADPDCLADGEAAALLAGHPWRRFAVLGDSVANGPIFEVPGFCPLRWTDRVAAELRAEAPDLQYLNLGVSGLLTHEVRDSQLAEALAFAPDLALVLCGGNDAF